MEDRTTTKQCYIIMDKNPMQSTKQFENPDVQLERMLTGIARLLFDFTDSQNDSKQLHKLDQMWQPFEKMTADYHNLTGRLHPDLCYDLGEWFTLKTEYCEAKENNLTPNLPIPLEVYRNNALKMIESLEK